jgi:ligand-binding SRPBCC domain-containing protein
MAVFQRSTTLAATAEAAYLFHEDPRNISLISPPSLQVKRVECRTPARAGETFSLKVSQFGLALEWIGIWVEAVPNERLVDGAIRSPFRNWRHEHLFSAQGHHCVMTDRVSYALPGGVFGRLLDETVMKVVFTLMFEARHRATKKYFSALAGSKH